MPYPGKKNFGKAKITKHGTELFLDTCQVKVLLKAVLETPEPCETRARDHAILFLGFHLALRISECSKLERSNFRDSNRGVLFVKRAKQTEKIRIRCKACGKEISVAQSRSGMLWHCPKCHAEIQVPVRAPSASGPAERQMPTCEGYLHEYIQAYLHEHMQLGQRYLFESSPGIHLSCETLRKVFNKYAEQAGLSPVYSFHSLRHGQGVQVYEAFKDPLVVRDMLGHKSIATANVYAHMSPARAAEVRDALEQNSVL